MPYETKTFRQFWWPYQEIGPVQNASKDAALRLVVGADGKLDLGAVVSKAIPKARILLWEGDHLLLDERSVDLAPERPWHNQTLRLQGDSSPHALELSIEGVIHYRPVDVSTLQPTREIATEPPMPPDIETQEELFLTAEHLEQYRHPTCMPNLYWDEALRRDPQDLRVRIAYGRQALKQGNLDAAAEHFNHAIQRLTQRHPNPYTGEAHYHVGLVKRLQGQEEQAYAALYKATWDYAWRAAGYYELALLDCRKKDYDQAAEHCEAALDTNRQHNKAIVLQALARHARGQSSDVIMPALHALLAVDPLDHWARYVAAGITQTGAANPKNPGKDLHDFLAKSRNDAQTILDLAYDFADAGFKKWAMDLLALHHAQPVPETAVPNPLATSQLTHYALAWISQEPSDLEAARTLSADYLFPSRPA